MFDDSATYASTGRSSSVLLEEVWSRSLQEQLHEVYTSSSASSSRGVLQRQTVFGKAAPIKDSPCAPQETVKLNRDSTCSIAW